MAIPSNITSHGFKSNIESVLTVIPSQPTDPNISSSKLQLPQNLDSILQRRFHTVLCFDKASEEDSGWVVAGWIKESLGIALEDQPLFAGRLRRISEENNYTDLEIVLNDSGVRMIEASVDMKLVDFVEMKGKREDDEAKAELVFWEDVVEQNPQFSPLFYVQITNFSCGGYSIGISCSLLLVDPFILSNFLKKWANLHKTLISKPNLPKVPIFYLPKLGKPSSGIKGSNTSKNAAQSVVFTIPTKIPYSDNKIHQNLAAICIDEAEHETGRKMAKNFSLYHKVSPENAKVDMISRQGLLENLSNKIDGLSCGLMWDDLGLDNVCFNEENKPVYGSCWINSVFDEGSVMIIPSDDNDSAIKIIVTFA